MKGRKAAHYSLKKALFQLGPEGKNFEKLGCPPFSGERVRDQDPPVP